MDEKLKQIDNKKQKLDSSRPLPKELVRNLEEWFDVELTYTSNAIEGSTLTRAETAEALEPERESRVEISKEQRFYTTLEVARLLQVDPESIRRYVRSGKLRAVKLGGKFIRIEKADLDKFIEGSKTS